MRSFPHLLALSLVLACGHKSRPAPARDSVAHPDSDATAVAAPVPAGAAPIETPAPVLGMAVDSTGVVVDAGATEPRVALLGGLHTLYLPAAMDSALRVLAPNFTATPRDAFSQIMANQVWERHPDAALFAVVGDFDGDGRADVAIRGSIGVVVVLNLAAGPRAECAGCRPEPGPLRLGAVEQYIDLQPRGVVTLMDEQRNTTSITLGNDAIANVYFQKASQLFYFDGSKWNRGATSE